MLAIAAVGISGCDILDVVAEGQESSSSQHYDADRMYSSDDYYPSGDSGYYNDSNEYANETHTPYNDSDYYDNGDQYYDSAYTNDDIYFDDTRYEHANDRNEEYTDYQDDYRAEYDTTTYDTTNRDYTNNTAAGTYDRGSPKYAVESSLQFEGEYSFYDNRYPGDFFYGMTEQHGQIVLTSYLSNRLYTVNPYDMSYSYMDMGVAGPHGLGGDPATGHLWVCDLNSERVVIYGPGQEYITELDIGALVPFSQIQPVNVVIDLEYAYVADRLNDVIYKIRLKDFTLAQVIRIPGMQRDKADSFIDMALYGDNIYVVSNELNHIVVIAKDGNWSNSIANGLFEEYRGALGLAMVDDENIYVNGDGMLYHIDLDGYVRNQWDLTGEHTSFSFIDALHREGRLFIAGYNNEGMVIKVFKTQ